MELSILKSHIVTGNVVEKLGDAEEYCAFAQSLDPNATTFIFPDGSVQVEIDRIADKYAFLEQYIDHILHGRVFTAGSGYNIKVDEIYPRRITSFGRGFSRILYEHKKESFSDMFNVLPVGQSPRLSDNELHPEELSVAVVGRRKWTEETINALIRLLQNWIGSVTHQGMHGEKPVNGFASDLEVVGRWAQFYLNVEGSGQNTLNWLTLTLLRFALETFPLEGIIYGAPEGVAYNPDLDKPVVDPQIYSILFTVGEDGELKPPSLPAHALAPAVSFPVWQGAAYRWDSLTIAVALAEASTEYPGQVTALLEHWLTMGKYGAFGGQPIHGHGTIHYDARRLWVVVQADMGSADERLAVTTLAYTLEAFHNTTGPIESLTLG